MKKLMAGLAVSALACALVLCTGCSSGAGSSSSTNASSTASSSVVASSNESVSASSSSSAGVTGKTIEVTLSGGSGRASIKSPAALAVAEDGVMVATIEWSSPNYDKMIVLGEEYLPINRAGNSTFIIPVPALDEDLAVQAETTAMSEPHMIDYTLRFDSSTLS